MTAASLLVFVDRLESEYVQEALSALRAAAGEKGWSVAAHPAGDLTMPERLVLLGKLAGSGASAAAFAHLHLTDDQADIFRAADLPLGYLGGHVEGAHCVADDGNAGAFMGASHLTGLGHRRIAHLAGERRVPETLQREAGFYRALGAMGKAPDPSLFFPCWRGTAEEGRAAVRALSKLPQPPTAVFASAGDWVAAGVYEGLKEAGLRIPQDVSVLGYDDLPMAATLDPPLDTVRQPLREMARRLAGTLIASALEPGRHAPSQELVRPRLVLRQSSGPAPRA